MVIGIDIIDYLTFLDTEGTTSQLLVDHQMRQVLLEIALNRKGIEEPTYIPDDVIDHGSSELNK